MKITLTAGALKKGDKIGNRTVRYSTLHDLGHVYLVYFEGHEEPDRFGRNEPITVELANPGQWFVRHRKTKKFWHAIGSFWDDDRAKGFDDEATATKFAELEIARYRELTEVLEVVFLQ